MPPPRRRQCDDVYSLRGLPCCPVFALLPSMHTRAKMLVAMTLTSLAAVSPLWAGVENNAMPPAPAAKPTSAPKPATAPAPKPTQTTRPASTPPVAPPPAPPANHAGHGAHNAHGAHTAHGATASVGAPAPAHDHGASADTRQPLPLNPAQRDHVLAEMRSLLRATQQVVDAVARDDFDGAAKAARAVGMSMVGKPEGTLMKVLPKGFMVMGMTVHSSFDKIADDAVKLRNAKHTLGQLASTLNTCAGCHDAYRFGAP